MAACRCGAWTLYEPNTIWHGDVLHTVTDCRRHSRSTQTRYV